MNPTSTIDAVRLAGILRKHILLFPPIDLMAIVSALGIHVREDILPPDLTGLYVRNKQHAVIILQRGLHATRRRFTLAHEIGHHVLGGSSYNDYVHTCEDRNDELQCNAFAAELLMPADLMADAILCLSSTLPREKLLELQIIFGVSREALLRRLEELQLMGDIMQCKGVLPQVHT